ncbi:MAG: hypothetical protein HXY39_19535 [Chloroflexi bacterium]|nr:hypothetical protein [Chloroflexota bacterium]
MYMMWFDDNARKAAATKIEEAIAAYIRHFKTRPNVVLVNQLDQADVPGVQVRAEQYVRRDNFWVGWEEADARLIAAPGATTGTH